MAETDHFYLELSGAPTFNKTNTYETSIVGGSTDHGDLTSDSGVGYIFRGTLGYLLGGHILLGATYDLSNAPSKRDASSTQNSVDSSNKFTEWGPSVGIVGGGFHLTGTYFLSGSQTYNDTESDASGALQVNETEKNTGGKGFLINIGYTFEVTRNFAFGPSLLYRHMTYSHQQNINYITPALNTDQDLETKAVDAEIEPVITLVFKF
jgi:hypothetical protein